MKLSQKIEFFTKICEKHKVTLTMTFQKAGELLLIAARKYKLSDQVSSSIVCERARKILIKKFTDFENLWHPTKFESGKLSIAVSDSSARSALFMRTHEILEEFEKVEFPEKIVEIVIARGQTINNKQ